MRIERLRVSNLRCFESAELVPHPAFNWLAGPNGAGKTTLLEAIFLLSHGRSFRLGGSGLLVRLGESSCDIYAELACDSSSRHRIGLQRESTGWRARMDGVNLPSVLPILERCAVACFEPGSSPLVSGAAEARRRFLNWGVFHVERGSVSAWRDYRRALGQRNALLRGGRDSEEFEFWELELERAAVCLEGWRRRYLDALFPHVVALSAEFLAELGTPSLVYRPGWHPDAALSRQLSLGRPKDFVRGYTRLGPHRDDWQLAFERAPGHAYFSRGQAKLATLICILAQTGLFREQVGESPVLCLDDLCSELDTVHQRRVFARLRDVGTQVFITSAGPPANGTHLDAALFHVEQGCVRQVVSGENAGDAIQWSV